MLIAGAGGFAKQLIEIFRLSGCLGKLSLYDDYTSPPRDNLYGIPILHSPDQVRTKFRDNSLFTPGTGGPRNRAELVKKFIVWGGELTSVISPNATVSNLETIIGKGAAVLNGAIIENGVTIGEGVLINLGAFVTHDNTIGDYTEISPGVRISGGCTIGSFCFLGTGAIILPKVKIGNNAVIAAGAVVTDDVPPNVMVAGIPAVIKKHLHGER